ncbi:MAG: hypothetical protein NVSMB5_01700 [Candidatus Velthaea sp.]
MRRTHGVHVREVASVGAPRTLLLAELGSDRPHIVNLAAGMHGDEPAAPWALYALVRDRLLDDRFGYRIWPCLNPSGYVLGTRENAEGDDVNRSFSRGGRTPEARAMITSNRDRKFALSMDLHEDFEATGFYAYEPLHDEQTERYLTAVVPAIAEAGFPIQDLGLESFDLGTPPEARAAYRFGHGSVFVDVKAESRFFPDGLPMSLFLLRQACAAALTFETPVMRAWDERIAMHRIAVTTALSRAG